MSLERFITVPDVAPSISTRVSIREEFYVLAAYGLLSTCFMLVSCFAYSSILKMEVICSSENGAISRQYDLSAEDQLETKQIWREDTLGRSAGLWSGGSGQILAV
jgi:hypothetical protein